LKLQNEFDNEHWEKTRIYFKYSMAMLEKPMKKKQKSREEAKVNMIKFFKDHLKHLVKGEPQKYNDLIRQCEAVLDEEYP
jgi:hypothetical protein